MAKEWSMPRNAEELSRRYKLGDISQLKAELTEIVNNLVYDDHLSSTSTNPVQNKVLTLALGSKVTAVTGKGLSTNDFTDADRSAIHTHGNKSTLDGITDAKITQWDNNSFSIDSVYPVGSIYMSVNNTNPGALFGGTWEQIEDTFLLSAGSTYTAGNTGGEATHKLTVNEIPDHWHEASASTNKEPAIYPNWGSLTGWGLTAQYLNGTGGTWHTGGAGGGQAHNNMPPYLVVYMWKRVS